MASELFERVVIATSPVTFSFVSSRDARTLRSTSRLFVEAVTAHRWNDTTTVIVDVTTWRECFPRAVGAILRSDVFRAGEAFCALAGIRRLIAPACQHLADAAFVHMRGIHTLNILGALRPPSPTLLLRTCAGFTLTQPSCCCLDSNFGHPPRMRLRLRLHTHLVLL